MKVFVEMRSGDLVGVRNRVELEGDDIVPREEAEVKIRDAETIPRDVAKHLVHLSDGEPTYFVTFVRHLGHWLDQCFVGVPLLTLMNSDLGPKCEVGCTGRPRNSTKELESWRTEALDSFLNEIAYNGFVSLLMNQRECVGLVLGVPYLGLYNILESIRTKVSTYLLEPTTLKESWTTSLLLSRPPFPQAGVAPKLSIDALEPRLAKHFWSLTVGSNFRGSFSTTNARVGVATNWGRTLNDSCWFASTTCRGLLIPASQFRTDSWSHTEKIWMELRELGVL